MPPTPGKIHTLPVKVSYTIDDSAQSYITVLSERQKVYVHARPASALGNNSLDGSARDRQNSNTGRGVGEEADRGGGSSGEIGSCSLKGAVWGVCYASPECVPSPTYHDFSVYALDPSPSPSSSSSSTSPPPLSRAFPSASATSNKGLNRWHGKGFLSWALYEPDLGSTLIRGTLARSAEFEDMGWNEGGLEGLMAAESGGLGFGGEDEGEEGGEGRGAWGLELVLSLKMVRLGGRGVGNKEDFGEMILRAREEPSGVLSSNTLRESTSVAPSTQHHIPPSHAHHGQPRRIEPRLIPPGEGSSPGSSNPGFRSARTSTSATTSLPHLSDGSTPRAPGLQRPVHSINRDSLPPSSLPMASSSSAHGPPLPPSRHSSIIPDGLGSQRSSSIPPPQHSSSSGPIPPSSSTANPTSETTPTLSKVTLINGPGESESDTDNLPLQAREREREVTPPPLPRPKSPPPSTPARLQAILRADAKLSPGLARSLASNPTLLRLLKSVPASAVPISTLNALKSPFGGALGGAGGSGTVVPAGGGGAKGGGAAGGGGGMVHDPNNPFAPAMPPPAFLDSPSKSKSSQGKPKPSPAKSTGSAASDFPTPASTTTINNPDSTAHTDKNKPTLTLPARSGSAHPPSDSLPASESKCDNCHATQSTTWRTRKAKDGRVTMKVCDECGLYFNQYKKMRPKEVWEAARQQASGQLVNGVKRKLDPPQGIRSSPRRSVSMGHARSTSASHPARSITTTTTATTSTAAAAPDAHPSTAQDSPRKRRKIGPPPAPSPRRNTRAAAKELQNSAGAGPDGVMGISANTQLRALQDDSRISPSPDSSVKRIRTIIGVNNGHGKKKEEEGEVQLGSSPNLFGIAPSSSAVPAPNGETVDLEAILRQFTNGGNNHTHHTSGTGTVAGVGEEGEEVVDIDKWFAEVGIDLGAIEADGWGSGDWAGGS